MAKSNVDLTRIFQAVTQDLAANQAVLDQADDYNHDHGTNMVQNFQTITTAMEKKKTGSASAKLAYAAKELSKNASSSSSKLYADHLSQAAQQFKGKKVDEKGALDLLGTLIGSQAGQAGAAGDLMGALLGGGQSSGSGAGDLMGALLGGGQASGGSTGAGSQNGIGLDDLLSAGMAFMQAKQTGGSNMQALVQAFAAGSGMGNASHREQSTQVVVQSFLQALGGMSARK